MTRLPKLMSVLAEKYGDRVLDLRLVRGNELHCSVQPPAVHALAAHWNVPARFFDVETLERETPRLVNPSDLVFRETGCHGVAEA